MIHHVEWVTRNNQLQMELGILIGLRREGCTARTLLLEDGTVEVVRVRIEPCNRNIQL